MIGSRKIARANVATSDKGDHPGVDAVETPPRARIAGRLSLSDFWTAVDAKPPGRRDD